MELSRLIKYWRTKLFNDKKLASCEYRIITGRANPSQSKLIWVQEVVSGESFEYSLSQLSTPTWLKKFSQADALYILAAGTEYASQIPQLFKPQSHYSATRPSIIIIGILFTTFLILSNLTAVKLVEYAGFTFPAGLVFFPLTYIFDDILTEVYGFKVSRRVIWTALMANAIIMTGTLLSAALPSSKFWHDQTAYATVFHATPRIFIASMLAYLCGEFTNSIILAKLKIVTAGKHLWVRAISSTAMGVGVDTLVFIHVAYLFSIPYLNLWQIIIAIYLFKVAYEIIAVPITYQVTNYLKRKDNIDHYDYHTRFNPFSMAVD